MYVCVNIAYKNQRCYHLTSRRVTFKNSIAANETIFYTQVASFTSR